MLTEKKKLELATDNDIRESTIEMLLAAGSGHTAGPLGMADIGLRRAVLRAAGVPRHARQPRSVPEPRGRRPALR